MGKQILTMLKPAAALLTLASFQALPALAQPGYQYPQGNYPQQYPQGSYPQSGYPQTGGYGQPGGYPQTGYNQPPVDPQRLDALVAPIALYPDALLGQVLVACTYPDQLAQAQQFLAVNRGLSGQALIQAAQQQPWDPSIQALVAFPDVVARLNQDPNWTAQLGQAFAADQGSVMAAVQRLRQQAYQSGRLQSNAQQVISTQYSNGAPVIDIEPANPDVIYVPVYNPAYYWGAPVYGYYPSLWYPGIGVGCYWGSGIHIGLFFGGGWGGYGYRGWGGWGGWGWRPNWGGRTVVVNNTFIHNYGFRASTFRGGYAGGSYRGGYSGAAVNRGGYTGSYGNGGRGFSGSYNNGSAYRGGNTGSYGNSGRAFSGSSNNGSAYRGGQTFNGGSYSRPAAPQFRGGAANVQPQTSYRGGGSGFQGGQSRSFSAPSAPRSFSNGGGTHYSAPSSGGFHGGGSRGGGGGGSSHSSGGGGGHRGR